MSTGTSRRVNCKRIFAFYVVIDFGFGIPYQIPYLNQGEIDMDDNLSENKSNASKVSDRILKDKELSKKLRDKIRELNEILNSSLALKQRLYDINKIKDESKRKEALDKMPEIAERIYEIQDMLSNVK